jgi:hypothetical protein
LGLWDTISPARFCGLPRSAQVELQFLGGINKKVSYHGQPTFKSNLWKNE